MFGSLLPVLALLASPSLAAPTPLTSDGAEAGKWTGDNSTSRTGPQHDCGTEIYGAYWRTWNDVATGFEGKRARMDRLPKGTDIALVFEAEGAEDTPYYSVLRDEYVPKLHAQGTLLARSIGTEGLRSIERPADGDYDKIARNLIANFVTPWGLDGLDFDIEEQISGEEAEHFAAIFNALSKYLGPKGKPDTLLIYDTNQDADPMFPLIADVVSFVFLQAYGRDVGSLQSTWDSYSPHIDSCRFIPGFSFYEERSTNHWRDTEGPFNSSRAGQYAAWQPEDGQKGGVFSYATDRDWKAENDDTLSEPTYEVTHQILKLQGKE